MSLLSRFFYKRPPDGLLEISDRVYVFDSCFSTEVLAEGIYQLYLHEIINDLHEEFPESLFLAFNFREGEKRSQFATILCEYDVTVIDYPRQYEGCPLLPLSLIHHFLRVSESWLSMDSCQNIVLLHCERGGWPLLAFVLASFLVFKKLHGGERKVLEMIYREGPRGLLQLLSPLNPFPSQLRYLQYISRRNIPSEWPPTERPLSLDCLILRAIPRFDDQKGCRPVIRIFGRNLLSRDGLSTQMLYSMHKKGRNIRHYCHKDSDVIKIDIQCLVQGDVVLECVHLDFDMEREVMMFRIMFNTAFIRSNILMLNCENLDILWDSKPRFPKSFRAEVLFGDVESSSPSKAHTSLLNGEEKGLPIEAFSKVQDLFNDVNWVDTTNDDAALWLLKHLSALNEVKDFSMLRRMSGYASPPDSEEENNASSVADSLEFLDSEKVSVAEFNSLDDHLSLDSASEEVSDNRPIEDRVISSVSSSFDSGRPVTAGDTQLVSIPLSAEQTSSSISVETSPSIRSTLKTIVSGSTSSESGTHPLLPPIPLPNSNNCSAVVLPADFCSSEESLQQSACCPGKTLPEQFPIVSSKVHVPVPPPPPAHSGALIPPLMALDSKYVAANFRKAAPPPPPRPPPPPPPPPLKEPLPTSSPSLTHDGRASQLPSVSVDSSIKSGNRPPPPTPTPPPPPLPTHLVPLKYSHQGSLPKLSSDSIPDPPPLLPPRHISSPVPSPPPTLPNCGSLATHPLPPPPPPPPPIYDQSSKFSKHSALEVLEFVPHQGIASAPPPPPPPLPPKQTSVHDSEPFSALTSKPAPAPAPPPPPPPQKHGLISNTSYVPAPAPHPPPPPPPLNDSKSAVSSSAPAVPPAPPVTGSGLVSLPPPVGNGPNVPPPPSLGKGRGLPAVKGRGLSGSSIPPKKTPLKPLHWVKVTRAMQGSLWADSQKQESQARAPEIDISELESLFSVASTSDAASKVGISRGSKINKPEKVQLVDLRRAYNCEIMLTKIKIPLPDMVNAILALDSSALDIDQVENLIKFCPSKDEMETLKNYNGDKDMLGKCEQFFLELMKVPRVESKLRVFAFTITFTSQVEDLKRNLYTINDAAREVKDSSKLRQIMQTILTLGNALNQGTARGAAVGFKLDSLLKLSDTRARNNKITLMHYLCKLLAEKMPELLDFSKDLAHLEPASKV
ncbi:hypothetical protein M569_05745, partial [Genlisea aurea]